MPSVSSLRFGLYRFAFCVPGIFGCVSSGTSGASSLRQRPKPRISRQGCDQKAEHILTYAYTNTYKFVHTYTYIYIYINMHVFSNIF